MRRTLSIIMILLGILILLAVAYFIVRAILMSIPLPPDPIVGVPVIALLGDPFHTTRKMKVPYKSRRGHVERSSGAFFRFIVYFTIVSALSMLLFQALSQR